MQVISEESKEDFENLFIPEVIAMTKSYFKKYLNWVQCNY